VCDWLDSIDNLDVYDLLASRLVVTWNHALSMSELMKTYSSFSGGLARSVIVVSIYISIVISIIIGGVMKRYRFQVLDGRRLSGYQVDAENEQQAKEYFMKYMSLLGAILIQEVTAEVEDEHGE